MNPFEKFGGWYERRHPIVKGILIDLPIISFLVSFVFMVLAFMYSAPDIMTIPLIVFIPSGFVILFIFASIRKKLSRSTLNGLEALVAIPFIFWGFYVIFGLVAVIYVYWQMSLLLLISVSAAFIVWKLWGKGMWELKKKKKAFAWELRDKMKELDEQLSLGHITQEEYEQRKKNVEDAFMHEKT